QQQSDQPPAAINALHDEILVRRHANLVDEFVEMRAGRNQREAGQHDRDEAREKTRRALHHKSALAYGRLQSTSVRMTALGQAACMRSISSAKSFFACRRLRAVSSTGAANARR